MLQTCAFASPASPLLRLRCREARFARSCRAYRGRLQCTVRTTPSSPAALGVPNLRDVSDAAPRLQTRRGALLRGSAPAICGDEARSFLSEVSRFVDLRTRDERSTDPHERVRDLCGHDFQQRVDAIPLLNRRRVIVGLAKVLPRDQVHGLVVHSLRSPRTVRSAIVRTMDVGGLFLLNRVLLEAGGHAIAQALKIITQALQQQRALLDCDALRGPGQFAPLVSSSGEATSAIWTQSSFSSSLSSSSENGMALADLEATSKPVYIYCSAGKDRTGLVVALILSVLGASEDEIIRDYVKSAETWENGPYDLRAEYSRKNTLSPFHSRLFCTRPPLTFQPHCATVTISLTMSVYFWSLFYVPVAFAL
jgi:Tyrosine phosphatase family